MAFCAILCPARPPPALLLPLPNLFALLISRAVRGPSARPAKVRLNIRRDVPGLGLSHTTRDPRRAWFQTLRVGGSILWMDIIIDVFWGVVLLCLKLVISSEIRVTVLTWFNPLLVRQVTLPVRLRSFCICGGTSPNALAYPLTSWCAGILSLHGWQLWRLS